jgi:hypothetical protein
MVFSQSIEMHYNAKKKKKKKTQMLIELGSLPKAVCRDLEVQFFYLNRQAIPIDFTKQSHINSQKQQKHF